MQSVTNQLIILFLEQYEKEFSLTPNAQSPYLEFYKSKRLKNLFSLTQRWRNERYGLTKSTLEPIWIYLLQPYNTKPIIRNSFPYQLNKDINVATPVLKISKFRNVSGFMILNKEIVLDESQNMIPLTHSPSLDHRCGAGCDKVLTGSLRMTIHTLPQAFARFPVWEYLSSSWPLWNGEEEKNGKCPLENSR